MEDWYFLIISHHGYNNCTTLSAPHTPLQKNLKVIWALHFLRYWKFVFYFFKQIVLTGEKNVIQKTKPNNSFNIKVKNETKSYANLFLRIIISVDNKKICCWLNFCSPISGIKKKISLRCLNRRTIVLKVGADKWNQNQLDQY